MQGRRENPIRPRLTSSRLALRSELIVEDKLFSLRPLQPHHSFGLTLKPSKVIFNSIV